MASIRSRSCARRSSSSRNGRIVSGGSTLTMQVARLLEPRTDRTFGAKLRQAVRAIQLERALTKDEILTLYLALAPYGGNLEGVRAASLAYFGKEPRRLSLGEAALLVAIPQSPEARRPDRSAEVAKRARDRVLDRVAPADRVPADEIVQAKAESVHGGAPADADVRAACGRSGDRGRRRAARWSRSPSTPTMQKPLEELARERARALGPDISVAIVAVDNATGEVLARVAGADYFDERRAGQVDMTQALRSPGSTLKPFIYGLALRGRAGPSRNADRGSPDPLRQLRAGEFRPHLPGHGLGAQGAAALAQRAGGRGARRGAREPPDRAPRRCRRALWCCPKGETPGLAMGLGGVGVTLDRPDHALRRARARRQHGRAHRAARHARRRAVARGCSIRSPPGMSATS